ncbi:MAG: Spx/MgsR family RNA polymerase-binding regulatory protein [Cyclobacteriaceae bacterium]|nr:Spx/MgsR family RNA polymerase-binding regulatory protein [Cyclobacteriaceae bacterium]
MKAALAWLTKNRVAFEFHDFKTKGITEAKLHDWSKQVGWEKLVNKRGTTWRKLSEAEQQQVTSERAAVALMKEKTSVIKRPVLEQGNRVLAVGFDEAEYQRWYGKK